MAAGGGASALALVAPVLRATANHPKNTYINITGYTASVRLVAGTAALTNGTDAFELHATANAVNTTR